MEGVSCMNKISNKEVLEKIKEATHCALQEGKHGTLIGRPEEEWTDGNGLEGRRQEDEG